MAGRVFFTVFAGRRRFLSLLTMYVTPLLRDQLVHEV